MCSSDGEKTHFNPMESAPSPVDCRAYRDPGRHRVRSILHRYDQFTLTVRCHGRQSLSLRLAAAMQPEFAWHNRDGCPRVHSGRLSEKLAIDANGLPAQPAFFFPATEVVAPACKRGAERRRKSDLDNRDRETRCATPKCAILQGLAAQPISHCVSATLHRSIFQALSCCSPR